MQIKAKAESELLMAHDETRDRAVSTLRRALSVYEYTSIEEEKLAYKHLKIVLNAYKNIERANFEAESLGLDNLVAELRGANNVAAVSVLNLEKHINTIEQTNGVFKNTFNSRSTNNINTTVYDTKLLRKNILKTYNDLAQYILVMAKNREDIFYKNAFSVVNNGRKYFADIIARRQGNTSSGISPDNL
ncbi:MAG: DUF6261 family protein [Limnohabitans sp.]|nr:DUF6261 family protein [Limnohabitans sp.]